MQIRRITEEAVLEATKHHDILRDGGYELCQ